MTTFASNSGKLSYAEIEGTTEGRIHETEGFVYILHPEIATLGTKYWENLDTMVEPALRRSGGNAVTDLEVRYGYTTVDFLLSMIVPLVNWGTIEVEGTAVTQ